MHFNLIFYVNKNKSFQLPFKEIFLINVIYEGTLIPFCIGRLFKALAFGKGSENCLFKIRIKIDTDQYKTFFSLLVLPFLVNPLILMCVYS